MNLPRVVVDTSVLVKWFHSENEDEVAESRLVHDAHRTGLVTAHILDLTLYELGNVLPPTLRWPPERVADALDRLVVICGPPLTPAPEWRRSAAHLSHQHRLSFYDASFAAAARALDADLLSSDRKLVSTGLARTPTQFVTEHAGHIRKTP